jgi:RNA polymerase sigma-70 factor (ECF subfamily)
MEDRIAAIYASGWSRIVATMIRFTGGDWDLAEECAQDAFTQALRVWPADGVPDQPLAWLTTVARRRALDRIRRAGVEREKLREVAMEPVPPPYCGDADIPDERLELMFTCCHPALNTEAQVALTLRTVAGMSTAEIARAFLVPEKTLGQRLFRAKQRIKHAGIPFRVPPGHLLPERLSAVLHVLYLLFNEGWSGREQLSREAIRICGTLVELMPDEPEALGLLALMLLQEARREARVSTDGTLLTLEEQDRSRWDRQRIDEGAALVERALRRGRAGPFQLQAAIAACHATAPGPDETDWPQIAGLYDLLRRVAPGPVVELNRAVAVAMVSGPEAGLALVETIDGLDGYHLLHATRAELLSRAGRAGEASASLSRALELAPSEAERRLLSERSAASRRNGPRAEPLSGPPAAG